MRKLYEKKNLDKPILSADEIIAKLSSNSKFKTVGIRSGLLIVSLVLVVLGTLVITRQQSFNLPDTEDSFSFVGTSQAAVSAKRDTIAIPSGTVKANPFLPYRNLGDVEAVSDVPNFDLVAPPEIIDEASDAARVMDTIVSGILYDKHSPSAILNIEGNDYLVKKGDVVNNYKVLDITRDSVTVCLGKNTYKAGIGEILTEGTVNQNEVSNLNKKFGGVR